MESIQLNSANLAVFERTLNAMAEFRRMFGRDVSKDVIAELLVAQKLGLAVCSGVNQAGYDALTPDGTRYQIKYRADNTHNVDMNNFDFDYLVLVNLDESYQPKGMWRITAQQAEAITTYRAKFRKYQTTQTKIKAIGQRLV